VDLLSLADEHRHLDSHDPPPRGHEGAATGARWLRRLGERQRAGSLDYRKREWEQAPRATDFNRNVG